VPAPATPSALVVAHRGAWGPAPPNSIGAFERAIELGCDAIELDVRATAEGRLAVVHDARVGGRAVRRLTLGELRARMPGRQAPLLEEVLELAAGRIALDVELKESGCCAARAAAIVARRLAPDRYVITSFSAGALIAASAVAPEARTGLLLAPGLRRRELDGRVRRAGAAFVAPHVSLVRRGILDWSAARGLDAWLWTVNDERTLRCLGGDARVRALITDRPERALARRIP